MSTHLIKHYTVPFPALNEHHRQESIVTDTVYSYTPTICIGDTYSWLACGVESLACDTFGMKTDKYFVNIIDKVIRIRGAINRLGSDIAQVIITD